MNIAWFIFKFLLSIFLIALAFGPALASGTFMRGGIGFLGSVFLFFVALLWIDWRNPRRPLAFIAIYIGIIQFIAAHAIATGRMIFPAECTSFKTVAVCELMNSVYVFAGPLGVAATPLFLGFLSIWASYALFSKRDKSTYISRSVR